MKVGEAGTKRLLTTMTRRQQSSTFTLLGWWIRFSLTITTYLHGDTRTMTSKLAKGSGARRRLSILSATLLSSQEGSTSVLGQSLGSTRSGAHVIRIVLFLCELISQNTKTIL